MTNFSQNEHLLFLVGKDVAGTATASLTSPNQLADGEIRCFTVGGTGYTEAAADADDLFVIALGRTDAEGGAIVSQPIKKSWVSSVSKKDYVADIQQLDYIGSNGTAGSIEVNNSTAYRATLNMIEGVDTNHGQVYVKDMVYNSDSSATQAEISLGLAASGNYNFSREVKNSSGDPAVVFTSVCDDAGAIIPTGTGTVAVNKGSKIITFATDVADATGATLLLVNEFLRFGTTVTSPVYKIISIDTTADTITLDRPYSGASNTAVANNTIERITVALGAAGNWGVACTGQDMPWKVGKINDTLAKWTLSLDADSFGATTTTGFATTVATIGTGTYHQVADMEYFANGNNGEFFRKGEPNTFGLTTMTTAAGTWDIITIELEKGRNDSLGYVNSPQTVMLAVPAAATASSWYVTGFTDDTTDVLEDLLDGVPAYTTANSFDGTALTTADLAAG